MTNVKIMINDREGVEKIAADPDVQIRIKDALVDGIAKRTVKAIQGEIEKEISNEIYKALHPKKGEKGGLFGTPDIYGRAQLSKDAINEIHSAVKFAVTKEIENVISECDIKKEYEALIARKIKEVNEYNFEHAVNAYIHKKVESTILKLLGSEKSNEH